MIEYLALLLAIPLGIVLAKLTKDEKEIYSKIQYFPLILLKLAMGAAIFYTINKQIALTLTFVFITVLIWNKA